MLSLPLLSGPRALLPCRHGSHQHLLGGCGELTGLLPFEEPQGGRLLVSKGVDDPGRYSTQCVVRRVELVYILPLVQRVENVEPRAREGHRGEYGWSGRHLLGGEWREANLKCYSNAVVDANRRCEKCVLFGFGANSSVSCPVSYEHT